LGRTIGYPTANIKPLLSEKLIPADGVYAVKIECSKGKFNGMLNIGNRPTVKGIGQTIEVNIFDFNFNIYDETIKIFFHKFIRNEQKFDGLEALKNQLLLDKEMVKKIFIS
jgi:riboflavin kinase/FMN adenylyltransferase